MTFAVGGDAGSEAKLKLIKGDLMFLTNFEASKFTSSLGISGDKGVTRSDTHTRLIGFID